MTTNQELSPKITDPNTDTEAWLGLLTANYPRHPQYVIDYSTSVDTPIVTCVVLYGTNVLLTLHGSGVAEYADTWGMPSGFLATCDPASAILQELDEELGIKPNDVAALTVAKRRLRLDPDTRIAGGGPSAYRRRWHEFRTVAILRNQVEPQLNWENRAAKWVPLDELDTYPLLSTARRTILAVTRPLRSTGLALG